MTDFLLPELGENVESGDVMRVMVAVGDTVAKDQPVIELETDKATLEVPSSVEGQVTEIKVKAGDKVKVGQAILSVAAGGAEARAKPAADAKPAAGAKAPEAPKKAEAPAQGEAEANAEDESADQEPEAGTPPGASAPPRPRRGEVVDITRGARPPQPAPAEAPAAKETSGAAAAAAPSVRRMAREIGVDINAVPGTGPGGRISVDDVKAYAKSLLQGARTSGPAGVPAEPLPDFSKWGEIEVQPMRAVRRTTARRLSHAWATIPHVTQHEKADVTDLDRLRGQFSARVEQAGGKLTVTAMLLKVVASALRAFPQFNASADIANEAIVLKKYVHVGVAVDTDSGLLVPVIRDADRKTITQLSMDLARSAERAKARKLSRDDMEGGTFTITNLGGFGGTAFSPIVNWPEIAILGVSRARMEPVYIDGEFRPRLMMPLSLSYDHRVIDGADAMRFVRWIVDALEQPFLMVL